MTTYKQSPIIEGMARALFVQAYASEQEERAAEGLRARLAGPGQDWMDVAPKTPRQAYDAAHNLAGRLEELNRAHVFVLWEQSMRADQAAGIEPGLMRDFGHYLAMQSLGHGVSWFDDHAEFPIKFPFSFEYHND